MGHASITWSVSPPWCERRRSVRAAVQPLIPSAGVTRLVALTVIAVFTLSCGKLLGITDPTPNEGNGDGGLDAPGDSGPQVDCLTPVEFRAEQTFALGRAGTQIAAGRLVAGGGLDLAIAQGDRFEIMTGNGLGGFTSRGTVGVVADGVVIGDFDNDGDDDVVTWNGAQVVASRQELSAFLSPQPLIGPFSSVQTVMTGFLDGAFVSDVIVKDGGGARRYFPNLSTPGMAGTFVRDANPIANIGATDALVAVQQVDDAEDDDVAVVSTGGDVKLSLAAAGDTHAAAILAARGARDRAVAFGRFTTIGVVDMDPDMIVGTASGGVLYIGNNGVYSELPGRIPAVTTGPIQVLDINGDDRDDLVLPTGIVYQCTPATPGGSGIVTQFEALDMSGPALVVDITADGKPDLIRVTGTTLRVQIQ